MRQSLNNRAVKEAIDQVIKNASIIGSIIHRIDQIGNPANRYEVIDISRSDGPLYAVVVVTNSGDIDILCECKTSDKARQIAAALGDSQ